MSPLASLLDGFTHTRHETHRLTCDACGYVSTLHLAHELAVEERLARTAREHRADCAARGCAPRRPTSAPHPARTPSLADLANAIRTHATDVETGRANLLSAVALRNCADAIERHAR